MIYRIDMQHFLSHAIDHFTSQDLSHFQYAIVSAVVRNTGKMNNVVKINNLYPLPEIVTEYAEHNDRSIMEKMYMAYLDPKTEDDSIGISAMRNIFYRTFVNPLSLHFNIMIVCDRSENEYIDVICKVLKKRYAIEVIDLNKLFSEGHVGPIYIDRDEIWDKCVDIRRDSARDQNKALASTSEGRMRLLSNMNKKAKIKLIEKLGFHITNYNEDDLDKILIDGWVKDEE